MKVTFLTVGKPTKGWATDAVAHYTKFLSKYAQVAVDHIKATSGRNLTDDDVRRSDSDRVLQRINTLHGAVILCDSTGKAQTSERLATAWRDLMDTHGGHAIVVVGGACGVDETVRTRADMIWSFGPATLPHDLALITAMEQLARSFSINRGESYHK